MGDILALPNRDEIRQFLCAEEEELFVAAEEAEHGTTAVPLPLGCDYLYVGSGPKQEQPVNGKAYDEPLGPRPGPSQRRELVDANGPFAGGALQPAHRMPDIEALPKITLALGFRHQEKWKGLPQSTERTPTGEDVPEIPGAALQPAVEAVLSQPYSGPVFVCAQCEHAI
ncbi:hypothetical protein PENSPDRAFT_691428 [Peniophora sp. CONT]|nr:hypothetical protein PENSPDRAFT_691428 [Peniophora sp. CONT]